MTRNSTSLSSALFHLPATAIKAAKRFPSVFVLMLIAFLLSSSDSYGGGTRYQVTAPTSAPTGAASFCQGAAGSYTNIANEVTCDGNGSSNVITWQWIYDGGTLIAGATGTWDEMTDVLPTVTLTAAQANTIPLGAHTLQCRYSKNKNWCTDGNAVFSPIKNITVNALPAVVTVSGGGTACANATLNASGGSGGTIYYQGTTSNGTSTGTASSSQVVSASGTYYFRARSTAGCWGTQGSAAVTINPAAGAVTASGAGTFCGATTITASGGSGGTIYFQGTTSNGTSTATASTSQSVSSSGTYYFRARTAAGCWGTQGSVTVVINPNPGAISGSTDICEGATSTLSSAGPAGTWSSSAPGTASVDASSGIVSGSVAGIANIIFTTGAGCTASKQVIVYPTPVVSMLPSATATVCMGGNATFTADATTNDIKLLAQDFNSVIGSWVVNTSSGAAANGFQLSMPPGAGTADGDGSQMLTTNAFSGMVNSTLTSPAFSTVGITAAHLKFNQFLLSSPPDAEVAVEYSVNGGGAWTAVAPSNILLHNIIGTGSWMASAPEYNEALPAGALGQASVMLRWRYNGNYVWAIDNIAVTVDLPASTIAWTGAAGLSCTNCAAPVATPTATGDNVYSVVVTSSGCASSPVTATVSVNPVPAPITGFLNPCVGTTTTLGTTSTGGTWGISDAGIATINSTTGSLTGISAGNATVSYVFSSGCYVTAVVTVNAAPDAITGSPAVCDGFTTSLAHSLVGGVWESGATGIATVDASGLVSSVSVGTAPVTYTLLSGCMVFTTVTVNEQPAALTGTDIVCEFSTTNLSSMSAGGTWGSSDAGIASVTDGTVTGVSDGTAEITYTMPTGCYVTKTVTVDPAPDAINGTLQVCLGLTTVLGNTTFGGTWSSQSPAIAAITSLGEVSGDFVGIAVISYTMPNSCSATAVVTVNPLPVAISGASTVCVNATTTLTNSDGGGTWSSSIPANADVDAGGIVTGFSAGTVLITYTLPTTCITTMPMTVNALPAFITGTPLMCKGLTAQLTDVTTGGTWSSSDGSIASVSTSGLVTGEDAGNANITYTRTSTGCFRFVQATVNPLPPAITGATELCVNQSIVLGNTDGTGTWSSTNIAVAQIDAAGMVAGMSQGVATIKYTLPSGCISSMVLTVNPLPADIAGSDNVCIGSSVTLTNTTASGTWLSDDAAIADVDNITGDVAGMLDGSTIIRYVLAATGCASSMNFTVNALPEDITGTTDVCKGLTTTLSTASTTGGWTSSTASVASVNSSGIVTGVLPGTSFISYTLPTGCYKSVEVTVNSLPAAITGVQKVCMGATTTLANASPLGNWSSGNTAIATVDAGGVVSGILNGTTRITYTLPTGCITSSVVTVNQSPGAQTGNAQVCAGSTTLLGNAVTGGVWTGGATGIAFINAGGTVTASAAGTAEVTYTLPAGCRLLSEVTVNPLPASITGTMNVCEGLTTALSCATINGVWSSGNTLVAQVATDGVATGMLAGVTRITYTLPTTCFTSRAITVNQSPAAITNNTAICAGLSNTLTNAVAGGTWSGGGAGIASITPSGTVTAIAMGNASVTYTLPAGCRATAEVTVNPLPSVITGNSTVCVGGTTPLSTASTTGVWSSSNTGVGDISVAGVVTGITAASFGVTYTLPTGCLVSRSMTVNPLPAAITGNTTLCQSTYSLLSNATSGGAWSSSVPSVAVISSLGAVTGNTAGVTIIEYTLPTGCAASTALVVNALPPAITGNMEVCSGATTDLENISLGGTWSHATMVATVNPAGIVTGVATGTARISYTMPNGCSTYAIVTVHPLPALIAGSTAVCEGVSALVTDATSGGTWSSDDVSLLTVDAASGTITGVAAGNTMVTYTLPTGCSRTRAIQVHAALPAISGNADVCNGASTTLANTESGGVWTSGNTTVALAAPITGVVSGVAAGSATITYTIPATGCKTTHSIVVHALPAYVSPVSVCAGSNTAMVSATSGGTWISSDPSVASIDAASGVLSGIIAGSVSVSYTMPDGCGIASSALVYALPADQTLSGEGEYCAGTPGAEIALGGSEHAVVYKLYRGSSLVSSFSGTGMPVSFGHHAVSGVYSVSATTALGCYAPVAASQHVVIVPTVTPTIILNADIADTVCEGAPGVFTTVVTNSGTAPLYTWVVNGVHVGTGSSYSYTPASGDVVKAILISNAQCATVTTVEDSRTMTVMPNLAPSIALHVLPGDTVCRGDGVSFSTDAVNGGDMPQYSWLVNGSLLSGASAATLDFTPVNGDLVVCKLNSSYRCPTVNDVASNGITMKVFDLQVPVVEIDVTPGLVIAKGQMATFTASVTNAGTAPLYQWQKNGIDIPGATTAVWSSSAIKNNDVVKCNVTALSICGKTSFNSVTMTVQGTDAVDEVTDAAADIRLAPNPNNGSFSVRGTLAGYSGTATIEITNMLGQVVYTAKPTFKAGQLDESIMLDNTLANGMYLLNISTDTFRKTFHFALKK